MADVIFVDLDGALLDHRGAVPETIDLIVRAVPNATAGIPACWTPGSPSAISPPWRGAGGAVPMSCRAWRP